MILRFSGYVKLTLEIIKERGLINIYVVALNALNIQGIHYAETTDRNIKCMPC